MEHKTDVRKMTKITTDKSKSRDIVNEILNFGVNEQQKIHIMYLLALNLESNSVMKEITNFLKKFQDRVNTDDDSVTIESSTTKKIILT